ncbi:hypothetical protein [Solibacillus sp. CAU 1738]|uniref:hypothetical protein n=1 Tax=Solibacillus sp. CAU 1738 TaxID=3140363 RepID=UPI0032617B51
MHIVSVALASTVDKISKRADRIIHFFTVFICITLLILLLLFPGVAHEGTDLGVHLFMEALFPYLLPYLILTGWLLRMTAKHTAHPFLLYLKTYAISAIGGFPTGAASIVQLVKSEELSKKEAAILLGICHCPSPLFVIGYVGLDLLGDASISWQYLILLHSFSLLLLCIVYFYLPHKKNTRASFISTRNAFSNSVKDSMPTVFIVCATIIFFTTIYTVIMHSMNQFFTLHENVQILFAAILEMTNGLQLMNEYLVNDLLIIGLITGLTAQSLSIHMQVLVIAKTGSVAFRPYIFMRLLYIITIPVLYWLIFI